jgi:hypothetical protein
MVAFVPTKTRRGKTIYKEVDAALYYKSSDEEGESPKRKLSKTPSHSRTTVPASLEDMFQWDGEEPYVPRITKVGLRLWCVIEI